MHFSAIVDLTGHHTQRKKILVISLFGETGHPALLNLFKAEADRQRVSPCSMRV